jgi:hypothetical protein
VFGMSVVLGFAIGRLCLRPAHSFPFFFGAARRGAFCAEKAMRNGETSGLAAFWRGLLAETKRSSDILGENLWSRGRGGAGAVEEHGEVDGGPEAEFVVVGGLRPPRPRFAGVDPVGGEAPPCAADGLGPSGGEVGLVGIGDEDGVEGDDEGGGTELPLRSSARLWLEGHVGGVGDRCAHRKCQAYYYHIVHGRRSILRDLEGGTTAMQPN